MGKKPNGYWTYERCREEAANYSGRRDFYERNQSAYGAALRNNWLDDFDCLYKPKEQKKDNKPRLIYAYEDKDNNWAYIGLAKNLKQRDRQHRNGQIKKGVRVYDTVWKHFNEIDKTIPEPKVRMEDLTTQEARYYEDWYKKAYQRAGWNVGNKAKTGEFCSSTGSSLIWDYEKCKAEAEKYKNRTDFYNGNSSAYDSARRNKWLDDFYCSKRNPKGYWNYERCKAEAAKYSGRGHFCEGNNSAYEAARKNKWLSEFYGTKENKWNYETCKAEASKYSRRGHFRLGNLSAYRVSRINGWLNDFFPLAA